MIPDEASLDELLSAAIERLLGEIRQAVPSLAGPLTAWMCQLARSPQPADYFRHPAAFPVLLLPWWLEKSIAPGGPRLSLQAGLVDSTLSGYYYLRLVDNLMDGHSTVERELLPAAAILHTRFQSAYQAHFAAGHPFWDHFTRAWFDSAETAARDSRLTDIGPGEFRRIASRKVCAALIPLAAVCYAYDRPGLLEPWSRFLEALGAWHQMWNDVFDWSKDLRHGTCTFFLSEARRRRRPGESTAAWVVREGFAWGAGSLQTWMAEARGLARPLHSPELLAYLDRREAMAAQQQADLAGDLRRLARLAEAMA